MNFKLPKLSFPVIFSCFAVPIIVYNLQQALDTRLYDLERQDYNETVGHYTKEEYLDLMKMLSDTNLADPFGHPATLKAFDNLEEQPNSILEIGFGLGQLSIILGQKYPNAQVLGIDAHNLSVEVARANLYSMKNPPSNVKFEWRAEAELNEPANSFDVITSTFVNHHIFPDDQFVDFLQRVSKIGKKAFIFNDFHRTPMCIISMDIQLWILRHFGMENLSKIAPYLPKKLNKMITTFEHILYKRPGLDLYIDGALLSLRRSFSINEYKKHLFDAGYPAGSMRCIRQDAWYQTVDSLCRLICTIDLSWNDRR